MTDKEQIATVRGKLSRRFISVRGLEIGAGSRPFPVPRGARVSYGDVRDRASLESYFRTSAVQTGEPIDAQTLAEIADASLDFIISAHVIEHLRDPIGAIVNSIRVLMRNSCFWSIAIESSPHVRHDRQMDAATLDAKSRVRRLHLCCRAVVGRRRRVIRAKLSIC